MKPIRVRLLPLAFCVVSLVPAMALAQAELPATVARAAQAWGRGANKLVVALDGIGIARLQSAQPQELFSLLGPAATDADVAALLQAMAEKNPRLRGALTDELDPHNIEPVLSPYQYRKVMVALGQLRAASAAVAIPETGNAADRLCGLSRTGALAPLADAAELVGGEFVPSAELVAAFDTPHSAVSAIPVQGLPPGYGDRLVERLLTTGKDQERSYMLRSEQIPEAVARDTRALKRALGRDFSVAPLQSLIDEVTAQATAAYGQPLRLWEADLEVYRNYGEFFSDGPMVPMGDGHIHIAIPLSSETQIEWGYVSTKDGFQDLQEWEGALPGQAVFRKGREYPSRSQDRYAAFEFPEEGPVAWLWVTLEETRF